MNRGARRRYVPVSDNDDSIGSSSDEGRSRVGSRLARNRLGETVVRSGMIVIIRGTLPVWI